MLEPHPVADHQNEILGGGRGDRGEQEDKYGEERIQYPTPEAKSTRHHAEPRSQIRDCPRESLYLGDMSNPLIRQKKQTPPARSDLSEERRTPHRSDGFYRHL
jgi:hypothetical protein